MIAGRIGGFLASFTTGGEAPGNCNLHRRTACRLESVFIHGNSFAIRQPAKTKKAQIGETFATFRSDEVITREIDRNQFKETKMRILLTVFLGIASLLFPSSSYAESADVEAVIEGVDEDHLTLVLNDGKKYQAPEEFNFDGLKKGVKVVVFYTETDGKRVINDLQVME